MTERERVLDYCRRYHYELVTREAMRDLLEDASHRDSHWRPMLEALKRGRLT